MRYIYKIECTVNNRVYIGASVNPEGRIYDHYYLLKHGGSKNPDLQKDWDKYGKHCFVDSIIEECPLELVDEREQYWIDIYGGIESGETYNEKTGGRDGKFSDKVKKKQSESKKGEKNPNYGKPAWNTGSQHSQKTKELIKQNHAHLSGKNNPNYGKPAWNRGQTGVYGEETIRKMSECKLGDKNPNFGKGLFGENNPMYGKSSWNKGKQMSPEAKEKMRETKKRNKQKRIMDEFNHQLEDDSTNGIML